MFYDSDDPKRQNYCTVHVRYSSSRNAPQTSMASGRLRPGLPITNWLERPLELLVRGYTDKEATRRIISPLTSLKRSATASARKTL